MRIEGVQCLRFVCVSNITLWVELGEILWVDKLRCGKLLSVIRIIARNVYTGRSGLTDHRATGRPIVLPLSELYCPFSLYMYFCPIFNHCHFAASCLVY